MKWKIQNNNRITDENENTICIFLDNTNSFSKALLKYTLEMYAAIEDYSQSNKNTISPRTPKKHHDRFQRILDLIKEASD